MPDLKLAKLPDRNPVKIAIIVTPQLNQSLGAYAELYRAAYGQSETVAELIPYMLETFLESDRGFAKAVKEKRPEAAPAAEGSAMRRARAPTSP